MNQLAINHLLREHRETEKIVAVLQEVLDAPVPWTASQAAHYEMVCVYFDRDVVCHIRKEDEALFPVLEEFLPRDVGPLAVLRGEHAEISAQYSLMRHAGEALRRGAPRPAAGEDFRQYGRRLVLTLRDHIYKEDRVLYPMVARFLSEQQDRSILQHMEGIVPLSSAMAP